MQHNDLTGNIKEKLFARRALTGSILATAIFMLAFLFLPYFIIEANATQRVSSKIDWGSVSLTLDPDFGNGDIDAEGHGDVDFGTITPTSRTDSNRGTMKVMKKTIGIASSGEYYTVYLSTASSNNNLNLTSTVDGQTTTSSSQNIPAIDATWEEPAVLTNSASWGYAVPGVEETGIPNAPSTFVIPQIVNQQIYATTDTTQAQQTYNQTKWSSVPVQGRAQQVWKATTTNANGFGTYEGGDGQTVTGDTEKDHFDIYYGIMIDTNILAGVYQNEIIYTALASSSSLDQVSSNLAHDKDFGGKGDEIEIAFDLTDSTASVTADMVTVAMVPHTEIYNTEHIDSEDPTSAYKGAYQYNDVSGQGVYDLTDLNNKYASYDKCQVTSLTRPESRQYITLTCLIPDKLPGNEYDFWIKVSGYNYDYISKDTISSTATSEKGKIHASFVYAGLQTEYASTDPRYSDANDADNHFAKYMQDMTVGVCNMTNVWGNTTSLEVITATDEETGEETTTYSTNLAKVHLYDHTGGGDEITTGVDKTGIADGIGTFALTDNRDNKDYLVRRLADGNCWMVQNLDLDLSAVANGNILLNDENSDFSTIRFWMPDSTILSSSDSETDTARYYDLKWEYYDAVNHLVAADSSFLPQHASMYLGDQYNYFAAFAEKDVISSSQIYSDSICANRWKLPDNNDYASLFGSHNVLMGQENADIEKAVRMPLNFVYSGYLVGSGYYVYDKGNMVRIITSSYSATSNHLSALEIKRIQGSIHINGGSPKWMYGGAIRCVAHGTELNSTASQEAVATTCGANKICYDGNGGTGEMSDQAANANASVTLTAPSYVRTGYAFAGWSTQENGFGTVYGPNETITAPSTQGTSGLRLYAKWLPSVGEMQTWTGCSALGEHQTVALTDNRDGNVYTVAKLKDGNCWMTSNLALNLADFAGTQKLTPANTDLNSTDAVSRGYWDPSESTIAKAQAIVSAEGYSGPALADDNSNYFEIVSANYLGTEQSAQFQSGDQYGANWHWGTKCSSLGECNSSATPTVTPENVWLSAIPRSYNKGSANLYNIFSGSAESVTASQSNGDSRDSICPTGWELPRETGDKSYSSLLNGYEYNNNSANPTLLWQPPVSFTSTSQYTLDGTILYTQLGFYQDSRVYEETGSGVFHIRKNTTFYAEGGKVSGNAIRCVLRDE